MDNVVGRFITDTSLFHSIREAIGGMAVMPSMRALMTAGPALDRDHMAGYNCSAIAIDNVRAFDEALYVLSCGTGLGFSVERQFVNQLPTISEEFHETDTTLVVADSRIGWASSFRQLLSLLYAGQIPKWDVSRVRAKGEKLKVFGGRASGPEPLVELFEYSIRLFRNAAGRKLNSIECHGLMCKIAEVIVVGGVRRSALISLSNLTDQRMRSAKSGQWWDAHPEYRLANNSVAYTEKPDMGIFMEEWKSLYDSKSGERGIFNRDGVKKKIVGIGRRDPSHEFLTNPCLRYDTPLLTRKGYRPIGDTVGEEIEIWNGQEWSKVTPFSTGVNELMRVTFTDGSHLDCTPYHKFLIIHDFNNDVVYKTEARNLTEGSKLQKWAMPIVGTEKFSEDIHEAYSQGFYAGDGSRGYEYSFIYAPKYPCIPRLVVGKVADKEVAGTRKQWRHGPMKDKSWVPINHALEYKLEWLAGLLDTDGTVTRDANGSGFQIVSTDNEFLLNVRLMLSGMGGRAKVVSADEAGTRTMPDGRGGKKDYECLKTTRLLIGNADAHALLQLGLKLSRLEHDGQPPQRDARQYIRVKTVEYLDIAEETFCVTEPKLHQMTVNGIVTGNCGEISLRSAGLCNLTEVIIRPEDTLETLAAKVEIATILGTIQSTFTDFRYVRGIWKRNAEEERLLGVSFTGEYDHPILSEVSDESIRWLEVLQLQSLQANELWADKLGITPSVAVQTIKPSGTVSQLTDTASGLHPRHSKYYIRSIRQDNKDPLTEFMKTTGIPYEPDVMKPDSTTVFYFPQKAPATSKTRDDVKALDHLELWKMYNEHWSEHQVSVTVNLREDDWLDAGAWVFRNFDEITGISFLPHDGGTYKQAPYQECTEEQYEAALAKMPKSIDWTKLSEYELEDTTTASHELACQGGMCEI